MYRLLLSVAVVLLAAPAFGQGFGSIHNANLDHGNDLSGQSSAGLGSLQVNRPRRTVPRTVVRRRTAQPPSSPGEQFAQRVRNQQAWKISRLRSAQQQRLRAAQRDQLWRIQRAQRAYPSYP